VLSPSFLAKRWPEYELRGLTAREIAGRTVILPIWHNITKEDLLRFSPPLADKLAVNSTGLTPLQIAVRIIKHIRPELFTRIARRRAYFEIRENAEVEFLDPAIIRSGPVQNATLPPDLVGRIRLVRAAFLRGWPRSMGAWLDSFKRDSHPSREVAIWEHMATVCLEYCALNPDLSHEQHHRLWALIVMIDNRESPKTLKAASASLPASALEDILRSYGSELPPHDFADLEDRRGPEDAGAQDRQPASFDKEHFPNDVPDHLIREIIAMEKRAHRVKGRASDG
jgi:hypothetical protein